MFGLKINISGLLDMHTYATIIDPPTKMSSPPHKDSELTPCTYDQASASTNIHKLQTIQSCQLAQFMSVDCRRSQCTLGSSHADSGIAGKLIFLCNSVSFSISGRSGLCCLLHLKSHNTWWHNETNFVLTCL